MSEITLGQRVKKYIRLRGLSQSKVARLSGISNDYMNRIANDKVTNPGIKKVEAIAKVLQIAPYQLQYDLPELSSHSDVIPENFDLKGVPLLSGKISAGDFQEVVEGWSGEIIIIPGKTTKSMVAWQISGKSMEPKYLHGDIVVIDREASWASNKDVIAMNSGNELTIKQLKILSDGSIELRPYNENFSTMRFNPGEEVHIFGVVVRLVRDM